MIKIDQFEVKYLFDRFERALRYDRRVKGLKARDLQLSELTRDGVCTFRGIEDTTIVVVFDALKGRIIQPPVLVKAGD